MRNRDRLPRGNLTYYSLVLIFIGFSRRVSNFVFVSLFFNLRDLTCLPTVSGFTAATTAAPPVTRPARIDPAALGDQDNVVSNSGDDKSDRGPVDDDSYDDDDDDDDGDPMILKSLSPDGQSVADGGHSRPWYLLGLSGNLSVVHGRQADFFKYLRDGRLEQFFQYQGLLFSQTHTLPPPHHPKKTLGYLT